MTVWLDSVSSAGAAGRCGRGAAAAARGRLAPRAAPGAIARRAAPRRRSSARATAGACAPSRRGSPIVVGLRFERFPATRDVLVLLAPAANEPQRRQQQRGDAETDPQQRRQQPTDGLRHAATARSRRASRQTGAGDGRRSGSSATGSAAGSVSSANNCSDSSSTPGSAASASAGGAAAAAAAAAASCRFRSCGIAKLEQPPALFDDRQRRRRLARRLAAAGARRLRRVAAPESRAREPARAQPRSRPAARAAAGRPACGSATRRSAAELRRSPTVVANVAKSADSGQAQRGAGAQHIDVAAERCGIRLVDRDHHLIDRDAVRSQPVGDRPQRLGALHGTVDAARGGRRRARRGWGGARDVRWRLAESPVPASAALQRAAARGAVDLTAGRVAARRAGLRGLHRRRRGRRRQQAPADRAGPCIRLHVAAARPRGFDQQRHERLGDRLARRDLHDVAATRDRPRRETRGGRETPGRSRPRRSNMSRGSASITRSPCSSSAVADNAISARNG